jgi:hydroxymethylglutaryl-CoA lyase
MDNNTVNRELSTINFVECPRDAMQGWKTMIPTEKKVDYLNALLKVGFDTLDFGSFVSPKAIPQMADTKEVLQQLDMRDVSTKLLAIIANTRGAEDAVRYEQISYLGFPFSISPTFQLRNTNSTIEESLQRVDEIQSLCIQHNKELVIYLSMGFGNPYGDPYDESVLLQWTEEMVKRDVRIISLADTVGVATPEQIAKALITLLPQYPNTEIGVHLHSTPNNWEEKLAAAYQVGCKRFDGALKGIGGCPMAKDELVGNMATEHMLNYFEQQGTPLSINKTALEHSFSLAHQLFV